MKNIGQTAQLTGYSQRMLRYFEEEGLLQPKRDEGGYRLYSDEEITEILRIRQLRELGFTYSSIKKLLPASMAELAAEGASLLKKHHETAADLLEKIQRLEMICFGEKRTEDLSLIDRSIPIMDLVKNKRPTQTPEQAGVDKTNPSPISLEYSAKTNNLEQFNKPTNLDLFHKTANKTFKSPQRVVYRINGAAGIGKIFSAEMELIESEFSYGRFVETCEAITNKEPCVTTLDEFTVFEILDQSAYVVVFEGASLAHKYFFDWKKATSADLTPRNIGKFPISVLIDFFGPNDIVIEHAFSDDNGEVQFRALLPYPSLFARLNHLSKASGT